MAANKSTRCGLWVLGAVLLIWMGALAGCGPEIKQDSPPGESVKPVFDAEAGTVPLPNDAALDDQGTIPDREGIDADNAQGAFYQWLSTLHGWLPDQTIEIPFDAPLDLSTAEGGKTVYLYRKSGDTWESASIDDITQETRQVAVTQNGETTQIEGVRLVVTPESTPESGEEYAVVATKGLEGADGEPVLEPQAMFFAASQEPLVDDNGNKTIETIPDDRTARSLESLRQMLQPVFERASEDDINRDDVAIAFRWSTVRDPKTVLDPASRTLPLPNDAAMEEGGDDEWDVGRTLPELGNVGENTAQGHFEEYLDRLHGWLPSTSIELPVSDPLDPETVTTDNIQLWRQPDEGEPTRLELEEVVWDEETQTVTLEPKEDLERRTRYFAFATADVQGADGLSLKLPAALQMAIQPHPVLENGESTVDELSNEQAQRIAGLRNFLRPATQVIESEAGFTYDGLGAIWTWHTVKDTLVTFDPNSATFGFPNEFARRGENGGITLPTEGVSGPQQAIAEELNTRQGFATTAPGWIPVDGPVRAEDTMEKERSVFLRWVPTLGETNLSYELNYRSESGHITFTPERSFPRDTNREGTAGERNLVAGAVTTDLKGNQGWSVRPTPFFVFLRSPHPLIEDGEITVGPLRDQVESGELSMEQVQQLEQNRNRFNLLLLSAQSNADSIDARHDFATAFAFHPENSTQTVQERRARAIHEVEQRSQTNVRETQGDGDAPDDAQFEHVATSIGSAAFDTVEYVDPMDGTLRAPDASEVASAGISVFIPKTNNDCQRPFEVVVAQHGLGGNRFGPAEALADPLAEQCLATVTMDFPLHGDRQLEDAEAPPAGQFFSADIVRSKNNVLQSIVDVSVLVELIQNGALESLSPTNDQTFAQGDDSTVGYVGTSLGGFVGVPAVAVDPELQAAVFDSVGARYSRVLTQGELGGGLLQALRGAGIEPDSFAEFRTLSLLQWVAESIDPLAYARYLIQGQTPFDSKTGSGSNNELQEVTYSSDDGLASERMPEEARTNDILLQMAEDPNNDDDDPIVPNATTYDLAENIWETRSETDDDLREAENAFQAFEAPHGVLLQGESPAKARCARRQAANWLRQSLRSNDDPEVPDELQAGASACEQQ